MTDVAETDADRNWSTAPFAATVSDDGRSTTVRVTGELDAATAPGLATAIEQAAASGRTVRLDMGQTSFIDSAGLRIIMRAAHHLDQAGASLLVVAASPSVEQILRLTGIYDALKEPGR